MAKKTGTKVEKGSPRKFRGFGHLAELAKKLDPEAVKRLALARKRSVERMVQEALANCEEK